MRLRWFVAILLMGPLLAICALTAGLYFGSMKLAAWQTQRHRQAVAAAQTPARPTLQRHETPPLTMRELAQQIADISGPDQGTYRPIELVQVGEQDYLLLIAGTQIESRGGNNLESAGQAVTRQLSPYQEEVEALIAEHIPPGSTLHLAGHSLGGMVANALATNQELVAHYTVKTVTTFAAPVNACPNPEVAYHRYVVEGDLVPLAHRAAIWSRVKGPLEVLESTCAEGYAYLDQTMIDHSSGPNGLQNAHSSYEHSQDLGRVPPPFPIDRFESRGRFLAAPQP